MPADGLTIGIDARAAVEVPAGRGRVVRELLRALSDLPGDHEYRCYARDAWSEPLDGRFIWVPIDASDPTWNVRAARRASRECDVFLSTNSYLTTWFLSVPGVPIIYDLIAFDPQMQPNRRSVVIERLTLGLAVRRSAAFIAISQATADALSDRFSRAAGRTVVAPLAASPVPAAGAASPADEPALPRPGFVLAVGTLEPRKNLARLVAAFNQLPQSVRDVHPLIVVGPMGWDTSETKRALETLSGESRVLGHVSDATLNELYELCGVFCYPSLGEGFGLPVLEAMAAGAAVVTSDNTSLPEVGGDAAVYIDPLDTDAIRDTLSALLNDPDRRRALGDAGRIRSREFTWRRFAETTVEVLESVGAQRRRS